MRSVFTLFSISFLIVFIFLAGNAGAQTPKILAPVKIEGKWAFINDSGKQAIPPLFNTAYGFKSKMAAVQFGLYWGYASANGTWALKPVFNKCRSFNNNRAQVDIFEPHDSVMVTGFIAPWGEFIYEIEPYEIAWDYHDNRVRIRSANNFGPAFGFRDTMGKWAIQPRFDAAMDFSEGLAAVMISNKWSFINDTGHMILPLVYDEVNSFNEELAYVKQGSKKGFINKKGKWAFTAKYDEVATVVRNGMVAVSKNGKTGFVNSKGKLVIKPQFDSDHFSYFSEEKAAVAIKGTDGKLMWGFIDKKGKFIIPAKFEAAEPFSEGLAAVKMNGKWGYIDVTGKIIIEPQFEEAYSFTPTY